MGKEEIGRGYKKVRDGTQRGFEFCYLNLNIRFFMYLFYKGNVCKQL
jgi:hypothetical protein